MSDTVGSVGEGAPLPARDRPRRLPHPINGTEQYLAAILDELAALRHEVAELRLDRVGLDEVKDGDPVLELIEPAQPAADTGEVELTEPAIAEPTPPPARPAKKAPGKKAATKKAPPRP